MRFSHGYVVFGPGPGSFSECHGRVLRFSGSRSDGGSSRITIRREKRAGSAVIKGSVELLVHPRAQKAPRGPESPRYSPGGVRTRLGPHGATSPVRGWHKEA